MSDFKSHEYRAELAQACEILEQQRNGRGPRESVQIEVPASPNWGQQPYVNWIREYGPRLGATVIVDGRVLPNPERQPVVTGEGQGCGAAIGDALRGLFQVIGFLALCIVMGIGAAILVGFLIAISWVH